MVNKFLLRYIAYREKDGSYTGVCLDLDIVEEGHASLQAAILSINDAVSCHMKVAKECGYPKELVFRPAPKEYWDILKIISQPKPQSLPYSQFQFFTSQSDVSRMAYA